MKNLDVGYINTLTYKYESDTILWYEHIILDIYSMLRVLKEIINS